MPRRWPLPLLSLFLAVLLLLPGAAQARVWRYAWGQSAPFEQQQLRPWLGADVVGMDVQLLRAVVEQQLGGQLELQRGPRLETQKTEAIRLGQADVITNVKRLPEHLSFARFSKPYRRVEMVVTAPEPDPQGWLRRRSEAELQRALQRSKARVGVIEGWYCGPALDPWLGVLARQAPARLRTYPTAAALVEAVRVGQVDLGLGERLSLASAIWTRNPSGLGRQVAIAPDPYRLDESRFMFSARTVSAEEVEAFDVGLASVRGSGAYRRIVRSALFPLLLEFSAGEWWFYPIELLGVFAAAVTGGVLALRAGLSVVGLVIVAMVTSIGGGVLRDAVINRPVPSVLQSPVYLGLVYGAAAVVVLVGLLARGLLASERVDRWLDGLDAVGIAAFTVTGVLIALRMHAEPLVLWGPQLSVLTACGGLLVREVILGRGAPVLRPGLLYIEIVFMGSLLLSVFLTFYSGHSTYRLRDIETAVLATMLGVISLRLAALRWRWRSPLLPGVGGTPHR